MKKLSLKWKLFLIFCYLQVVIHGLFLVFLIIQFFRNPPAGEIVIVILFTLGLMLVFLNNVLCIYIVHRFFPDTMLPSKTRLSINVSGIINIALSLGLLIMCVSGWVVEFSDRDAGKPGLNDAALWLIIIFSVLWILGVYTLILQFLIPGHLRRASRNEINALIDSIGQEQT